MYFYVTSKQGYVFYLHETVYWFSFNKRIAVFTRKIWCGNPIKVAQAIVANKHLYIRIDISFRRVYLPWKRGFNWKARAKYSVSPRMPDFGRSLFPSPQKYARLYSPFPLSSFCQAFIIGRHSCLSRARLSALYVRKPATRRDIFSSSGREEKRNFSTFSAKYFFS